MLINFLAGINFTSKDRNLNGIEQARNELKNKITSQTDSPHVSVDIADIKGKVTMSIQELSDRRKILSATIERDDGYASRHFKVGSDSEVECYLNETSNEDIYYDLHSLDRTLFHAEEDEAKSLTDFY